MSGWIAKKDDKAAMQGKSLFELTCVGHSFIRYSRIAKGEWAMILKPQDVLVLLKLVKIYPHEWAYNTLAVDLGMSPSEVHAAVKRAVKAERANQADLQIKPNISRLEEFLVYGIQYVFVPDRGELTRRMPTAFAAEPLLGKIVLPHEPSPVWSDPKGPESGWAFSPRGINPCPKQQGMMRSFMRIW
jgi:hypothetical protein